MLAYSLHCDLCKILLASIMKVGGSAISTGIVLIFFQVLLHKVFC